MHLFQQLFDQYNEFHQSEISTNRFSPDDFLEVLGKYTDNLEVKKIGESVEGRPISTINLGHGPVKVFLWSQMHGNESTATRAILDLLYFFTNPDSFTETTSKLLREITICVLPMLNPDGTLRFQRRNALEIDLNRDARSFEAPESKILSHVIASFKPDYAFNLHDQRRFYNIPGTGKPSTIAFLAPAYNLGEEINASRLKAMQLIAHMRSQLENIIPGQVGLYDDSYSPRAFGDYTQGTGASTILIESGWAANDEEKEFVRKLNFCLLITAFESIADDSHTKYSVQDYKNIPINDEKLFDLLIRKVNIRSGDKNFNLDIGIQRNEISILNSTAYYTTSEVADIGDLQEWYGFEEVDASSLVIEPGLVWRESKDDYLKMFRGRIEELLKQGYLYLGVSALPEEDYFELPINLVPLGFESTLPVQFEEKANFLLKNIEGKISYVVINGFLWDTQKPLPENINGVVIK